MATERLNLRVYIAVSLQKKKKKKKKIKIKSEMLICSLPNINFCPIKKKKKKKKKKIIVYHDNRKTKFSTNILKSQHLRIYKADKAETFQKYP